MKQTHLYLSAKFTKYLFHKGLLEALLNAHDTFTKEQNYAFKVRDRNIARLAVIKALAEGKEIDIERVKEIAKSLLEDDTKEMKPADSKLNPF